LKTLSWRTVASLVVLMITIVYLLPSIKPTLWPHKKINLGLDLQGGMHLILEVDVEKAIENTMERISQEIRAQLKQKRIRYQSVERTKDNQVLVSLQGQDQVDAFNKILDEEYRDLKIINSSATEEGYKAFLAMPDEEVEHTKKMSVDQALETIRNRIDQFGVSEPDIRRQGENRILIQLPGVKDTQRAKDLIGKTAILEFKLVDEGHDVDSALKENPPPGTEILYQIETDPATGRSLKTPFLLKKRTLLTGAHLTDAKVQFDSQYNEPYVSIEFDRKGARIFEDITGENIQKRLAIVLDNKVYSAPVIQDRIAGGQARITGNFTHEDARDLAIVLRAGALPAPVTILEERTVGPSLGADSINKGFFAMCIGGILVVLFMGAYYKTSGLIADFALILNIFMIAAGLAAFQATLTLPGMAGIVLTIGMAVDANVLIFERIREEMELGKTPLAAVDAGFDRAALTILDANITTLIAALVLFQFGTGPVKGFAVTLSLGVISSVFTALVLTRQIFDFLLINRRVKQLSI